MRIFFAGTLLIACFVCSFGGHSSASNTQQSTRQDNQCVRCHSTLSTPVELSGRFLDWRASRHGATGVTCDKCHGGDATSSDPAKAHSGIFRPGDKRSRLNDQNVPQTCAGCHQAIAATFVESQHYRRLRTSELGPSCADCHGHMGSAAARRPYEAESLCTYCHNTLNGLLPQRPDIVRSAKASLDAIDRTNYLVGWIEELLGQAEKQKLNVAEEKRDTELLKTSLANAKIAWHAFSLEGSMSRATKGFDEAVSVKDRLVKKLGHD